MTVITEHEERVERKEVISYSGNSRFVEEVEGARVEVDSSTYRKGRDQAMSLKSPTKSPYKRDVEARSPERDQLSPMRDLDFHNGRRALMANLANKFRDFDEDEDMTQDKEEVKLPRAAVKPPPRAASPSKHAAVRTDHLRRRSPSPTKANPLQFVSPSKASPVVAAGSPA